MQRTPSSVEVLDAPANELSFARTIVYDVQVNPIVRSVPVKFNPWPRKTVEEARTAVNPAHGSSSSFLGSSDDVPGVEDLIDDEDSHGFS